MRLGVLIAEPDALVQYKHLLVHFMSWKHGKPVLFGKNKLILNDAYPTTHEFTTSELQDIISEDVCKWMSLMAYHIENPTKEDRPIYATKNSLAYTKKALSYFMVYSDVQWNDVQRFGNPTKSKQVNFLLHVINKLETSNQGKKSSANRAFEYEEFAKTINILSEFGCSPIEKAM
jgi:hypothetical protein